MYLERERHANVRRGDLSYPIRGVRTGDYLYLWNLEPDRWLAGDPEFYWAVGEYGDVDSSPTKDYLLLAQKPEPYFRLCFGKRPAEGALRPEARPRPDPQHCQRAPRCDQAFTTAGGGVDEAHRRSARRRPQGLPGQRAVFRPAPAAGKAPEHGTPLRSKGQSTLGKQPDGISGPVRWCVSGHDLAVMFVDCSLSVGR